MYSRIIIFYLRIVLSSLGNTHQLLLHLYLLLNVTLIVVQDAIYVQIDSYVPYENFILISFRLLIAKLVLLRLKINSLINTGGITVKS